MTFEEWAASQGYYRNEDDGRFRDSNDYESNAPLDEDMLFERYSRSSLFGAAGAPVHDINIGGQQYSQIGSYANNDPELGRALQIELDYLKQSGITPVFDAQYGWIAPVADVERAHPALDHSSIFDLGPLLIPALLTAGGAFAGLGEVAGGGALAGATEGGITAADFAATTAAEDAAAGALMSQGAADAGIGLNSGVLQTLQDLGISVTDPMVQSVAKQAVGGAIQSGIKGGDPLEGAVMGGALGGLSSGIGGLTSGLTDYPIVNQMAGSGALSGIVAGATGGDPLEGALSGATAAGIGNVAGDLASGLTGSSLADKAIGNAGASAVYSGIMGGDPAAAALSSAMNTGMNAATGAVWNAAKGVWEDATTPGPLAEAPLPDSYWNMTAGSPLVIDVPGLSVFNTVDEAVESKSFAGPYTNVRIDEDGIVRATGPDGVDGYGLGLIDPGALAGERSKLAQERLQVEGAEQAQREQEAAYAAQQAQAQVEAQRIAQEQAQLEAQRLVAETTRADGTPKGDGYLGPLTRPDGKVSTELSIGVNIDGKETEIPSLVPTLTQTEVDHLLSGGNPTPEIVQKAVDHAVERIGAGESPFAGGVLSGGSPVEPVAITGAGGTGTGDSGVLNALPAIAGAGLVAAGQAVGDTNMPDLLDFLVDDGGAGNAGGALDEVQQWAQSIGATLNPDGSVNWDSVDQTPILQSLGTIDEGPGALDFARAADSLGLQQMGQAAGLTGPALAKFVASGGTMGSTAAGGGGVGYGASALSSPYINFAPVIEMSQTAPQSDRNRLSDDIFSLQNLAKILGIGAGVAGVASIADKGLGGGSTTTQTTSVPGPSAEEIELIKLNAELARKQIASIDQLQPFQKALLEASYADLAQQQALSKATSAAIPPEEQAALARAEFDRSKRLGPIQEQLLQKQLDIINRNGAATPEQAALIKAATDAAIESGTADINLQTKRGIGLISDELANARGLRLTDTPILREATLLSDRAGDQVANLVRNLRASEATAKLNYPLAVAQTQSNITQGQQSIADAAKNFQDQLRQQAVLNRQSMLGQTSSTGIGLANTGNSSSALNALLSARLSGGTRTSDTTQGIGLTGIGQFAAGIGSLGRTINESGIFK